jgi:hypothetical protein
MNNETMPPVRPAGESKEVYGLGPIPATNQHQRRRDTPQAPKRPRRRPGLRPGQPAQAGQSDQAPPPPADGQDESTEHSVDVYT